MKSIYGNIEEFNGQGYVSFLDILGFSNEIMSSWGKGKPTPLEKLLKFKNIIESPEEVLPSLKKTEGSRIYVCRTYSVSDSIIVSHGIDEPKVIGDLALGVATLLGNISHIWSYAISIGYTLRGAIDFGDIYWNKSEIIGPSFIKAYSLESSVAKVSRVLFSSDLNELLFNLFIQSPELMSHQAKYFMKDIDGYIILNPHTLYTEDDERLKIIDSLETMKGNQTNFLIKEKYTPLLNILKNKDLKHYKIDKEELRKY